MITNLRRALLEANIPQVDIAARVGISDTLLSEFVCGHRPIRPIYHLLNLADALGRRPSELLGITEIGDLMSADKPDNDPNEPRAPQPPKPSSTGEPPPVPDPSVVDPQHQATPDETENPDDTQPPEPGEEPNPGEVPDEIEGRQHSESADLRQQGGEYPEESR